MLAVLLASKDIMDSPTPRSRVLWFGRVVWLGDMPKTEKNVQLPALGEAVFYDFFVAFFVKTVQVGRLVCDVAFLFVEFDKDAYGRDFSEEIATVKLAS